MIADDFRTCFGQCDVIAGPVAPSVAWTRERATTRRPTADIFTLPASLAGLPGMSPGRLGEGGLPVGLS